MQRSSVGKINHAEWRTEFGSSNGPLHVALLGILVACAGLALVYGSLTPRGLLADEPAHTAYAIEIGEGRLPDLDTVRPGDDGGAGTTIYVASHPPLFAAVQGGVSKTLESLGIAERPELAVGRALNAICTLLTVLVVARCAAEVAGNDRVGLLAAGLFAATPALWSLSTFGYSDGIGVLAVALVAWAGVCAWNRATPKAVLWLGGAVALCGATRAMALVVGVAIALLVIARILLRSEVQASASRGATARRRASQALRLSILALGPALLVSGWWYLRTWLRFGDPTGSKFLNGELNRPDRPGGIPGQLVDLDMWQRMLSELAGSSYTASYFALQVRLPGVVLWIIGIVTLVSVFGLLLPERLRPLSGPSTLAGWPVLVAVIGATAFAIAGHTSGGGAPHPRYFLLALPVVAILIVVGLDRLHPRLAILAVGSAVAASLTVAVLSVRWVDRIIDSEELTRFGPAWLGYAGVALVSIGVAAALVSLRSVCR